jgi:4'-phosphopantetheinyl transferase EntD
MSSRIQTMSLRRLLPTSAVVIEQEPPPGTSHRPPTRADRQAARRDEFARGRQLAHDALGALGVHEFEVLKGVRGAPSWPPGVAGSITHSRGFVAAAVVRSTALPAIGIDVERARWPADALATLICAPLERARLRASLTDWRAVFSAKESIIKAVAGYTGHVLARRDVAVDLARDGTLIALPGVPLDARFEALLACLQGAWEVDTRGASTAVWLVTQAPGARPGDCGCSTVVAGRASRQPHDR